MSKCNINFESKYARLNGSKITIDDYLSGNCESTGPLYCIPGNHELISVNPVKRRAHFRHKYSGDLEGSPMTAWHVEWQSNFPDVEVNFRDKIGQLRNRRADVVIHEYNHIIEIQHSKMDSGEVNERIKDYALHGHIVKWVIHGQNCVKVKMLGERRILEFSSNYWLFEAFLACDIVYYDIDGFIYKVSPKLVKSYQVDVSEPKLKSEFIESLKSNIDLWENDEPPQCFLYLKQQGAGSGKTYGMMQMLDSDKDITHYKYIALITKQHSAVKVMLREFDDQYTGTGNHTEKKFKRIENLEHGMSKSGNQYIRKYTNTLTNTQCIAIFGTVDSFTNSLGESPKNVADKFTGIVQSIRDGTIKTINYAGKINYATVNPILNKEMLIMIDETQDLTETYGEAFLQIVRSKSVNLCVVGDRLQSLSFKDNTLTYLQKAKDANMRVIHANTTNIVRRFSDPTLIKFVNDLIPFESYNLPSMTPEKISDKIPGALHIFKGYKIYSDQSEDDEQVVEAAEEIMKLFKEEVESNGRIPEDFLIVTPFTQKNPLVEALQIALNLYWKDLMENNTTYIESVKSKDEYWKNVDTNQYIRYAIFHKSQDGCSINTNESIHSTRIVSIHSSKGDGRKVVFVIGVSQSALQHFSQVSNNLIYDSLLHVAITRQKEKLYFRVEQENDDIYNKIEKSGNGISLGITAFDILKKNIKLSKISDNIVNFSFDDIYKCIISKSEIPPLPSETKNKKLIIDMGDHNIRYGSMFMNIMIHCCNHELKTKSDTRRQFYAILNEVKYAPIKEVSEWKQHYNTLKNNNKINKKKYIPILNFPSHRTSQEYKSYYNIIRKTMDRVRAELESLGKTGLNYFCPYESAILYYIIETTQEGIYQKITISDLYNITDVYSKLFDSNSLGHENCECKKHFSNKHLQLTDYEKDYKEYLFNHFDRLEHVNTLLDDFDKAHLNINWLYSHMIKIDNNSFNIYKFMHMIGYTDKSVYTLYIKPQFNDLNFNQFLVESLLDTYLLCNLDGESENFKRFGNKPVVSYVISCNKDTIYEINWTNIIRENRVYIQKLIYSILYEMFSSKHVQFYEVFINIVNSKTYKGPLQIIEHCENKFKDTDDIPKFPQYLTKAWNSISDKFEESDKDEHEEILQKYMKKDAFIKLFDNKLKGSLRTFLNMQDD